VEAVGAVPAAGSHATRDIMAAFTLRWQYAERLKREFGTVEAMDQADARVVSLPADKGFPGCRVYASMLALVMRVRWEETFRAVQRQLPPGSEAKYHLVVVTGGSSQTPGLDALARYVFGVPAQAVTHHDLEADDTVRSRPEYSAVLGLAHEAVQRALRSREGGWLDRLLGGQP
jgi:cell division protein FtsA